MRADPARFLDAHTVLVESELGARRVTGEVILIATGSRPARPVGIDFSDPRIHDSDEILELESIPQSMTILGAGVIGCEYACMFAALGVRVTLVDSRRALLSFLDGELVDQLTSAMQRLGVEIRLGLRWTAVAAAPEAVATTFDDGSRIESDQLTSVTLYRVGALGSFAAKDLELRPGTYTVIGSRDGYRDVRQTFTVRPGRNLPPISIVCVEPI